MSDRYRGRYAAHLSIDFDIDAGLEGLKDFEELREDIRTGLTPVLKELIVAELGLDGMAKVERGETTRSEVIRSASGLDAETGN